MRYLVRSRLLNPLPIKIRQMHTFRFSLPFTCMLLILDPATADTPIDFNREIRPILSENCFQCHGPDLNKRKAKLRLDTREGAIASAIVPGKAAQSKLVKRIISTGEERMPPEESNKKLTSVQVELLKRWIEQGAEYKGHWAFIPPVRSPLPAVKNNSWPRNAIDRFILARLEHEGMKPSAAADAVTLIRRLSFDLTGLPPTIVEVDKFLQETSVNPDVAYEKLVDRLLGSPHYGERMAVDWLDAARFADTHGYHIDSGRNMTRWREYVIDSFNKNKRFDEFTIEQLAGDLLPNATLEQKIASGFNRNHMINFEGGAIPEEYQNAYIIDRVNTTATVWMGVSLGCAQCHDHKFDPFTQKDYYQLYAFFNNVPERGLDGQKGNAVPFLKIPTKEQEQKLKTLRTTVAEKEARMKASWPEVDAAQIAWERSSKRPKIEWKVQAPAKPRSMGQATLTVLADKSILAAGPNPEKETYTFSFSPDLTPVTAIRIETLADERFPAQGPGRSANGNFVLTGVRISVGDDANSKTIGLKAVSADFSQKEYPISNLLQKSGAGWAIHPQVGKNHWAVLELTEPIVGPAQNVTVELQFNSPFAQHQFGRFRVAATNSTVPHETEVVPAGIETILRVAADKRNASQKDELRAYYRNNVSPLVRDMKRETAALTKQVAEIESKTPDAMVMEEMPKPRDTFMRIRGQYDQKGAKVTANTPAALPALTLQKSATGSYNRLDLARWLVRDDHPLTARVIVNRFWQMYFGAGLVRTSEDFGSQGDWPSHPELLDWLAVEFRESGWDVKKMERLIVMSATYRQSSVVTEDSRSKDPENRLLSRMSRLRLQAEFIRDQALSISGLLNGEIGGTSVLPYQPRGIWEELAYRADGDNFTAQKYVQSKGKDLYRRTMYTFWKRTAPPPSLITLDAPDRETCTVRRSRTNTPLQALVLMNDPTYVEASRKLAERILVEGGSSTNDRLTFAFRLATSRKPSEREFAILNRVYDSQRTKYQRDKASAEKLLKVGESPRNEKMDPGELAAWAMVANTILNLDEALTKN